MLRFNNKLAFAIKVNENTDNSVEASKLYSLLSKLSARIPGFVAEGIGNVSREAETVEESMTVRFGNTVLSFASEESKKRMVCVGVNDRYDVSKEYVEDLYISLPFAGTFPKLPVYDLKRDFNTILDKFKAYMLEKFGEKDETPQIVYHSQFMRVGNRVIRYDNVAAVAEAKRQEENSIRGLLALLAAITR